MKLQQASRHRQQVVTVPRCQATAPTLAWQRAAAAAARLQEVAQHTERGLARRCAVALLRKLEQNGGAVERTEGGRGEGRQDKEVRQSAAAQRRQMRAIPAQQGLRCKSKH